MKTILGDLNAKVGKESHLYPTCEGRGRGALPEFSLTGTWYQH
jgi:hypothetical protein